MKTLSIKTFFCILIVLAYPLIALHHSSAFGQDRSEVQQVGEIFHQFGESYDIEILDEFVFMATSHSGLQIFDVTEPANPELVGAYEFNPDMTYGLAVTDDFAYLADREGGLRIIDISDVTNPFEVGFCETPGDARGVDVLDNIAVVADGRDSGVRIIDISNPDNPEEITSYDTPGDAYTVRIMGDLVYVADGRSGMLILDISNPENPRLISSYNTPGYVYDLLVAGRYAYLADGARGVIVVDVNNPGNPETLGEYDTPVNAKSLAVTGNFMYVADREGGLIVLDISDRNNLRPLATLETPGQAQGIAVSGNFAYIASYRNGMQVADISDPRNPEEIGSVSTPGWWARNNAIDGQFCYLANSDGGLRIIDVSDPANPDSVGSWDSPGTAQDVVVEDGYAYIADGSEGVRIIDVSDPENPDEVASVVSSYALCVKKVNEYLFVADGSDGGLRVIDVSDPERPVVVRVLITNGDGNWLDISGNFLYMADGANGMVVISIEDPERPAVLATFSDGGVAMGVKVAGDYAYLIELDSGLRVVDISNPRDPRQLDIIETPGIGRGVMVSGNYAYIGAGEGGLRVIDVSNPEDLSEAGFYDTPGYAYAPTLHRGLIYLGDGTAFRVYDFTGGDQVRELNVNLEAGWNMISLNVSPPEEFWQGERGPAIVPLMERLRVNENRHHIILLKDGIGRFYSPAFNFNNIPFWNLSEGYLLNADEAVETVFSGAQIPFDADIPLADGWNLAAYFPTYELNAGAPAFYVLSNILDNLILAKDRDGRFMNLEWRFSNMPPWRETQGYQIKVDGDVALRYPEQDEDLAAGYSASEFERLNAHWQTPRVTDNNMSILIASTGGIEINPGNEIAAVDSEGNVVGVACFDASGRAGISVWGDDAATEAKDGLSNGEPFTLRLWNSDQQTELEPNLAEVIEGSGLIYGTNSFSAVSTETIATIPEECYLEGAFPNPFNSKTIIKYTVTLITDVSLQVFDINGRLVATLVDGVMSAGMHSVTWDAGGVGAGVYFVRLKDEGGRMKKEIQKVVLVK